MAKRSKIAMDNKKYCDCFLRDQMTWYNKKLDDTEESIMNFMRIEETVLDVNEMVHCLINERENIKYKLKDTHKKLYG